MSYINERYFCDNPLNTPKTMNVKPIYKDFLKYKHEGILQGYDMSEYTFEDYLYTLNQFNE